MLDLAVGLGVVRAILHQINLITADSKRFEFFIKPSTGDKNLCCFTGAGQHCFGTAGDINAFGLTIPDITAAIADPGKTSPIGVDINTARCWHDTGLITRRAVGESFTFMQFDNIEIGQGHRVVISIDNGFVAVVKGRDMHDRLLHLVFFGQFSVAVSLPAMN